MGVDNVATGFVEGFVGLGLDKLVDVEFDLDEIGVGVLCLEIAAGVDEGRVGLEEVGVDLDNVALGFVEGFGGFELDKHVDVADFDLDEDDIGGVDVHGIYVGIGHREYVSSPYSSP